MENGWWIEEKMQQLGKRLKSRKTEKIQRKLIERNQCEIKIENKTRSDILYEVREVFDGVKPKLSIVIRRLRKIRRKKNDQTKS